jgi:hypothetical protein
VVQFVKLAFKRGDARRAPGHRQRVVGHALDLAHNEGKHSVGKQRGQERQRIEKRGPCTCIPSTNLYH